MRSCRPCKHCRCARKTSKASPPSTIVPPQAGLQSAVATLGTKANLLVIGQQATVTFKGLDAAVLAQRLARTRSEARLVPAQAKLTREGSSWSGTVKFNLPGG